MIRLLVVLGLLSGTMGCAAPPPPPEHLARKLAVLPVNNRNGEPLVVSGDGLLDRYVFRTETATVSEVLEAEAVFQLRAKGFEIATPLSEKKVLSGRIPRDSADAAELAGQAGLGPICLYLEVRRWEPEGRAHVNYVIVDVEASLVDVQSRTLVWKHERRGPIGTPGNFLLEAACITAARRVAEDLLAPLVPAP